VKGLITIVVVSLSVLVAAAQPVPDSRGTEFWFTFLPNFHNQADVVDADPTLQPEHHVRIEIAAERPTRGEIRLRDSAGRVTVVPFSITRPQDVFSFQTFYGPYELYGFNRGRGGYAYNASQCNRVALQSMHVVADDEVSVYALNQAPFTSDAFMVLPTDALGRDYVIMSYPSSNPSGLGANHAPSQFAVVAVEDNTVVTIRPTAPIVRNVSMDVDTVVLNRGESYLVQVDMRANPVGDLTGSVVLSDKPVAVFAGHQRTTLPAGVSALQSRDCLVEQMNPVETWGKRAFIAPFRPSRNEERIGTDLYRVVARFDRTEVTANGTVVATINAGEHYEAPLTQPVDVRASRPVMVAAFKKTSSSTSSAGLSFDGDPLMVLVPPEEQYMTGYTFVSIQTQRVINFIQEDVYVEQYVNVVLPNQEPDKHPTFNLRVDGRPVTPVFTPIHTSGWRYATLPLSNGAHTIEADTLLGIYVYGYGQAVSYGYIGGTAYRPLDVYPPVMSIKQECDSITIIFTDNVRGDKGLRSISVTGQENVVIVRTDTIESFAPVATIKAMLDNPYADGWVNAKGVDAEDQDETTRLDIAGFTVAPPGHGPVAEPYRIALTQPVRKMRCAPTTLTNYGRFPQTITSARLSSGQPLGFTVPLVLQPGQSITFDYCVMVNQEGLTSDTLLLEDSCIGRTSIVWNVTALWDREAPRITALVGDPCDDVAVVDVVEDSDYDFGIMDVRLIDSLSANVEPRDVTVADDRARLSLRRVDSFQDVIWMIEAIDSAGNRRVFGDTIPGFTLSISSGGSGSNAIRFQDVPIGSVRCDSVVAENYGLFPLVIDRVTLAGNILFSIPLAQFPITLKAGERRGLVVCYAPQRLTLDDERDRDTMFAGGPCADRTIIADGTSVTLRYAGVSRCDVPVELDAFALQGLTAVPLPASNNVTLIAPRDVGPGRLDIVSLTGSRVASWPVGHTPQGSALMVDVSDVVDGTYVAILHDDGGVQRVVIVVRH
jgi:hypothetical protein